MIYKPGEMTLVQAVAIGLIVGVVMVALALVAKVVCR